MCKFYYLAICCPISILETLEIHHGLKLLQDCQNVNFYIMFPDCDHRFGCIFTGQVVEKIVEVKLMKRK